jgi:signal peptidase I
VSNAWLGLIVMKTESSLNIQNISNEVPPVGEETAVGTEVPADGVPTESDSVDGQREGDGHAAEQQADKEKGKARPRPIMRELIETVLIVLVVFLVVRTLVQNFVVEGDSMLPTLHSDQYLLVNKTAYFQYDSNFFGRILNPDASSDMHYLLGGPQRGDIVVFNAPTEAKDFIKRVIALEGETIEVRPDPDPIGRPGSPCGDCGVYVNGVRLNEPYIRDTPDYRVEPMVVPKGYVYVLGDNRRNSTDSHAFGPLAMNRIVGTAFISYWPTDRWGIVAHPTYPEVPQP